MNNYMLFFENPINNKNIDWIQTDINNVYYIFNETELNLLDKKISDSKHEYPQFWIKFKVSNYQDIICNIDLIVRKNLGVIIDMTIPYESVLKAIDAINKTDIETIIEINSCDQYKLATSLKNLNGVIIKGSESSGFVGNKTSNILYRELISTTTLPLFIKGGFGINTILPYILTGAKGVVFDVQILGIKSLNISDEYISFLNKHKSTDTMLLGACLDIQY